MVNGLRDSLWLQGMTRGVGLVGLVLLPGAGPAWGEEAPPTCPTNYKAEGKACVHTSAIVGANVTLQDGARVGPDVVIKDGVTIGKGAKIGQNAEIGPMVVIKDGVTIGQGAKIGNGAEIGNGAAIGKGAEIGQGAESGQDGKDGPGVVVGQGAEIGPMVVIKDGVTISNGAKIGRKTVIESEAKIGEHVRLGKENVVKQDVTVEPNERTRSRTLVMKGKDGTPWYSPPHRAAHPPTGARQLRPSASTRLGHPTWPADHEQIWTAFCDTPTTGAFKPAGGGLRPLGGKRAEVGIGHRRVYTVCVDVDKDDTVRISPSPANRWPRALSFQALEILTRQASTTPMTIAVDGIEAMEMPETLGLDAAVTDGSEDKDEKEPTTKVPPNYHRHYTPTFKEGSVTVHVKPPAESGADLADRTLALAATVKDDKPYEAGQLEVLGKSLAERTDIPSAKAKDLRTALQAKDSTGVIAAIEALTPVTTTSQTIQVEGFYNLSVFTGVGIVTGDARSNAYEIVEIDGVRSLASDGSSYIDPELVVGATLIPGRKPKTWTGFDLGISTALGVVSADEGGLESFRSVYVGPTLGWRALALTPALAIKRGTHLRDGNTVGMYLPSSATDVDDLTEQRWGLGMALMLTIPFAELNSFQKAQNETNDSSEGN